MDTVFRFHAFRRDISNFSILKYRDFEGYLVTGQHSGTHWLKYMLSCAIAHKHGYPTPKHTDNAKSNDFIGHPKHKPLYPDTPRIASTHQIPHRLYDSRLVRTFVQVPPSAILFRDIRHALVSFYEKWHGNTLNMSFSEFLRGDKNGHQHWADIWWHIRFYNRWGRTIERFPEHSITLYYEDLKADAQNQMSRIFSHFGIDMPQDSLAFAVSESSREKMAAKADSEKFVRFDKRDPLEWYSQDDMDFFKKTISENLKYAHGYNYLD
ncbi:sulfotransferase domain-containing protein [Sneathiella glossodoripedis]|uniref:sulfotransferase domain-containing protein n=1 Tax=Sneathiella glossodoripedis TaxID=418853 RepID=UPI0004716BCC|nr:sulfotransferase domain-containing protein [Sneathiella glossodoripedis]